MVKIKSENLFKNVLVLTKKSAYKIYFQEKNNALFKKKNFLLKKDMARFKAAHDLHYETVAHVQEILTKKDISFRLRHRGQKIDYSRYSCVITIGGDGTFLEASRNVTKQIIIGINSAPSHSVGNFCQMTGQTFEYQLDRILRLGGTIQDYPRLRMRIDNEIWPFQILNDILIAHKNPGMLCRYYLEIGARAEEHRSSGLWISAPAGSTGAIRSAGGKELNPTAKKVQYMPRELYSGGDRNYNLKGGVLTANAKVTVTSLMRKGQLFLDGAHHQVPFPYGSVIQLSLSNQPIRTLKVKT